MSIEVGGAFIIWHKLNETFIMESGVELLWLLLSGVVEIQTQVGVQSQTKVVVHHKDLQWQKRQK